MSAFFNELASLEGRYAKAFYSTLSSTPEKLQKALKEIEDFNALLKDHKDFSSVVLEPLVHIDVRLRVLERVLKPFDFSKEFRHFVGLVLEHGRMRYMKTIFAAFIRLYQKTNHITPVTLSSAHALSKDELAMFTKLFKDKFGPYTEVSAKTDPALLAGYRIETPEEVFDGSFQKQLRLIQQSFHER